MSKSLPPPTLSQGLNKTINQTAGLSLVADTHKSSDVTGTTIFSEEGVNHGAHLDKVTLMSYGFTSLDVRMSIPSVSIKLGNQRSQPAGAAALGTLVNAPLRHLDGVQTKLKSVRLLPNAPSEIEEKHPHLKF